MGTLTDDRRAFLLGQLGLSVAAGEKYTNTDLEVLYDEENRTTYDGEWINMLLENGFTSAPGYTAQYMKDSRGWVHTRGRVISPAGLTVATGFWVAPVGYRSVGAHFYFHWTEGAVPAGTNADPKFVGVFVSNTTLLTNYDTAGQPDLREGIVYTLHRFAWATI